MVTTEVHGDNLLPLPLCPPQTQRGPVQDQTRVSAVMCSDRYRIFQKESAILSGERALG